MNKVKKLLTFRFILFFYGSIQRVGDGSLSVVTRNDYGGYSSSKWYIHWLIFIIQ